MSRYEYDDSPNLPEAPIDPRRVWALLLIASAILLGFALWAKYAEARWTPQLAQEWGEIPEHVQKWFKQQVSPKNGIPCCDVADGYKTSWAIDGDHYIIPSQSDPKVWIPVPNDVVISNTGNPNGNAVVWWAYGGEIRCFVPGGGV